MSEEDDRRAWEAEEAQGKEGVQPLAVTPGTATTTIEALFTAMVR